ncbi:MAG: polyprenyl synthetase family protein [Gammaproteobacteria bacterium]
MPDHPNGAEFAGMHAATDNLVASVLHEYAEATRGLLFDYLPDAEPRRYLYDLVADYPRRGGRGLRPSICIATARAFGAPLEAALRTAVSIELVHNAMLIHDDIEDESEQRRGTPTLHAREGIPIAINAGDMLAVISMRPLLDNPAWLGPDLSLRVLQETERMSRESAEGQALELGWRRDNVTDVSAEDYLLMILKKTCWLATIHPSRMGALIGSFGNLNLDHCIRFGFFLGAAFQIQDDLLNLEGDAAAYGKEIGGDIWEGKRTLMLIHVLERASQAERERISTFLAKPRIERCAKDVKWVRGLMDDYGSIAWARETAQGLAGAASYEFGELYGHLPESRDKRFLEALPAWVIARN